MQIKDPTGLERSYSHACFREVSMRCRLPYDRRPDMLRR